MANGRSTTAIELPGHVRLLTEPAGETVTLSHLDLDIWGKPHMSFDDNRPLDGLPPRGASTWQVALAHGQLVLASGDLHRSYLITSEQIAASDRDYIALGHWDVPRDVSAGPVAASYSGSPQPEVGVRPRHAVARRRRAPGARRVDHRRRLRAAAHVALTGR